MAASRGRKVAFLTVIFGVPVAWYLILQFFGSNEFALDPIRELQESCRPESASILILRNSGTTNAENALNRIKQNSYTSSLVLEELQFEEDCDFGSYDAVFVDDGGQVLGEYRFNVEDMDRLITEVELYYSIREENGTGN